MTTATQTTASRCRSRGVASLREVLCADLARIEDDDCLRTGAIVFRSAEGRPPDLTVQVTDDTIWVDTGREPRHTPLVEVVGDPRRVDAILRGRKDARRQYLAGQVRVHGDLGYLSRLGCRLGLLDRPVW
ncbi:hypothetical protein [Rhodococcus olei]|uniref:hypothetical protein n=1 Tax=Rhodococcus olei TaxID=2161675 RepID=UPI0031ED1430